MFYYSLTNFIELASSFPELLNSQICDVTAKIPATEACVNGVWKVLIYLIKRLEVSGNVELGQYIFYQIPVDSSAGTTIKLEMLEGAATIYVSESSRLPSAANYDFLATANTAYPGQIYISPAQLQTNTAVYASVVGLEPENNFTLCNMLGDTVENYTTVAPPTTSGFLSRWESNKILEFSDSSCISVDLIFILDRSQSIMPDYYNSVTFKQFSWMKVTELSECDRVRARHCKSVRFPRWSKSRKSCVCSIRRHWVFDHLAGDHPLGQLFEGRLQRGCSLEGRLQRRRRHHQHWGRLHGRVLPISTEFSQSQ